VNQVRDDIKNPNAPYRAPGGNVLEHTKLVDLYVESGAALGYDDKVPTVTSEGVKMGQRFVQTGKGINWKIVKGRPAFTKVLVGRTSTTSERMLPITTPTRFSLV
jgi:hypothetical protein